MRSLLSRLDRLTRQLKKQKGNEPRIREIAVMDGDLVREVWRLRPGTVCIFERVEDGTKGDNSERQG